MYGLEENSEKVMCLFKQKNSINLGDVIGGRQVRKIFILVVLVCFLFDCGNKSDQTNKQDMLWKNIEKKVWLKETWNFGEVYEDISFIFTHMKNRFKKIWKNRGRI